jgi:hypothetical protein
MTNKKLLNSFVEYYCPRKQCNEKLTKSQGKFYQYFKCENCEGLWTKFAVWSITKRSDLDYEHLKQLKDYFNEQKTI